MDLLIDYWPLWTLVIVVIAMFALLRLYAEPQGLPYEARGKLVTKSELRFYRSLYKLSLIHI